MIAKAIGPQNSVGAIGQHAQHGRQRRQQQRPQPAGRRRDRRLFHRLAGRTFIGDLGDQDHRVLRDHPDQGENTQDRDEAKRAAKGQKRRHDPDQPERQQDHAPSPCP